jgi:3D (Asp-Asp-Asp) domain-containing protein
MIADEYDFWDGQNCGTLTWDGVVYSGTTLNPPNVTGTFCTAFLADARLQGSGVARDGRKIKYNVNTGQYYTVSQFTGSDGSLVVANQTVARDPAIIPTGGVHVDLQGLGDGLLANDTGSRITGYRIDLLRGQGHAVCDGWPNPIVVGTCSPGNSNCPPRSVE